jgi:hypothetical protein
LKAVEQLLVEQDATEAECQAKAERASHLLATVGACSGNPFQLSPPQHHRPAWLIGLGLICLPPANHPEQASEFASKGHYDGAAALAT